MKIYILKPKAYWLFKIGITTDIKARKANIETTAQCKVRRLLLVRVWRAKRLELSLHQKLSKWQRTFRGSGKTEYFALNVFLLLGLWLYLVVLASIQRIIELASIFIFAVGALYLLGLI